MDELKISDKALEESVAALKKYCAKQIGRIEDFLYEIKNVKYLSNFLVLITC